ncbi:MAG: asparagine synthase-related protein [Chromatiales bacterium]|nr:asparagine synthase-related protein [Chromatiales bacterium]
MAERSGRTVRRRVSSTRCCGMDATTLIVDDPVKRVDNMTMAWGLEARVPFLDHELVELAMRRCRPELKLGVGRQARAEDGSPAACCPMP